MKKNRSLFTLMILELCIGILMILKSNYSIKLYVKDDGKILQTQFDGRCEEDIYGNVKIGLSRDENPSDLVCKTDSDKLAVDISDGLNTVYTIEPDDLQTYVDIKEVYPHNSELAEISFDDILDKYFSSKYTILISTIGDGCTGLSDESVMRLKNLGVDVTPADYEIGAGYICVINAGDVLVALGGEQDVSYTNTLYNHKLVVTSAGNTPDAESKIRIDGIDYSYEKIGINVVVYDFENNCLIDSLNYNTQNNLAMTRNYNVFYKEYEYSFDDKFVSRLNIYILIFKIINYTFLTISGIVIALIFIRIRRISRCGDVTTYYNKYRVVLRYLLDGIIIILSICLPYGMRYLKSKFGDVSFAQLLYHMTTNLDGTNWSDFKDVFLNIIVRFIISIGACIVLYIIEFKLLKNNLKKIYYSFAFQCICMIGCFTIIISVMADFSKEYELIDYLVSQNVNSQLYEENYVNPQDVKIEFPSKKKNLIYIFMESMEITNASYAEGGGKAFNCIPELTDIAYSNDCFNGNSGKLNGALTLGNTGWTVAGMVAQTSGVPLNVPIDGNFYRSKSFLPGDYSIGQVLQDNGYNNCLLIGSEAEFGGRKTYFTSHGNYEICDLQWAKDEKLIPEDYKVWWGYEDKKLFEYAKSKVIDLEQRDEPFNLTILTADTHFTDGYYCEECEELYNSQYANVLACSSRKINEFIEWLKEQGFYEDTVIILSGDHLCMDSAYYEDVPENYQRRTFVSVINSSKKMPNSYRQFCTMDMFPTTLSAMGCE